MSQRALFVANPNARHTRASADEAATRLQQHGFQLERLALAGSARQADALHRHLDAADLVVAAGGDGTVNALLGALIDHPLPLGIIPLGTANDLARTLDIPLDVLAACDVIAAGHTRRIDVSTVNGRYFCNVASIGLSVQITRELTGKTKRHWGILAYALAAVRALRGLRRFHATIHTPDGSLPTRTVQIAVGNGKYYGSGMAVAADAAIDDHLLHVYTLEVAHWWEIVALFPALWRGSHIFWRGMRTLTTAEVRIETRRPRLVDIDGELATRTPAHLRLLPAAIAVFCPAEGPHPALRASLS